MQCPACATALPENAKFCGACGHQFAGGGGGAVVATAGGPVKSIEQVLAAPIDLPPPVDLLKDSWATMQPALVPWVVATVILGAIYMALAFTGIGSLVVGPFMAGLAVMGLLAVSGKAVEIPNVFGGLKMFVPLLLLSLVVGIASGIGMMLLIIPGLYLSMAFMYSPFLVIDREMEFIDAMKGSMNVVNASLVPHIVLVLVLGLVNFVGSIPCGLGSLVTMPLTMVAMAAVYKRIFGVAGGANKLV